MLRMLCYCVHVPENLWARPGPGHTLQFTAHRDRVSRAHSCPLAATKTPVVTAFTVHATCSPRAGRSHAPLTLGCHNVQPSVPTAAAAAERCQSGGCLAQACCQRWRSSKRHGLLRGTLASLPPCKSVCFALLSDTDCCGVAARRLTTCGWWLHGALCGAQSLKR